MPFSCWGTLEVEGFPVYITLATSHNSQHSFTHIQPEERFNKPEFFKAAVVLCKALRF